MAGAIARNPAWCHLAALGNELREGLNVFVIDSERLVGAETTHFAPEHGPATLGSPIVVAPFPIRSRAYFSLCHRNNTTSFSKLCRSGVTQICRSFHGCSLRYAPGSGFPAPSSAWPREAVEPADGSSSSTRTVRYRRISSVSFRFRSNSSTACAGD